MAKNVSQKPHKKKTDWRKIFVTALALLMVLAMVLPLMVNMFSYASAATQDELKSQIAGLKSDAEDAKKRKQELEAQLKALSKDQDKAMERKSILDQQLYELEDQIENTQEQIDTYTDLIAQQEITLSEAQEREVAAYDRFCERARSMEESGPVSYWSVLFAARDYADLLDRLALVDEIMSYDNKVVNALAAARAAEEEALAQLNESKAGLEVQKAELDAQREEQQIKVDEAQALMDELQAQEDKLDSLIAAEKAEMARIDDTLTKKEKELEDVIRAAKFTTGSGYAYPLPTSYTYVTSRFGPRTDPITGKLNSNHGGMDIPAPQGTPITAVQGGVVITSSYAPASYGEYVAISHGNGTVTLYAHMSRGTRKVKAGDVVSQGQVLGLVGSTGYSTGNHLHLELRKNGIRVDPEQMFPKVDFTFKYNY